MPAERAMCLARLAAQVLRSSLAAAALLCVGAVGAQTQTFCCEDANGHRICGNPLPAQCYNRAYKQINSKSGRVLKEEEAPLSAEERVRREQAAKLQREAEARVAERRRRDKVLMESYTSVTELDARRDTVLAGALKEVENLRRRESELVDERGTLDERVAKLKGKTAPRQLQEDLAANASELEALRSVITQKEREITTIRARFEEDRQRFVELSRKN